MLSSSSAGLRYSDIISPIVLASLCFIADNGKPLQIYIFPAKNLLNEVPKIIGSHGRGRDIAVTVGKSFREFVFCLGIPFKFKRFKLSILLFYKVCLLLFVGSLEIQVAVAFCV